MKIYEVGGCVRDRLLGNEPKDIDYVVVGSTQNEMLSLGYQQVGKDFPVFLKDGSEYALARIERKTGNGYNGFTVESDGVTLEEDLFRRDLTINAMAMDSKGNVYDPYNGKQDLENKVIRHVSKHFAEDPLRVLRAARFAARYNFTIAPETLELMKDLGKAGELSFLVKERVWAETVKVFKGGGDPSIYFNYLAETGNLENVYKIKSLDYDKISEVYHSKTLSSEQKMNLFYLLVYSNQENLEKVNSFDQNVIDWNQFGKNKVDNYSNKQMYAPSAFIRMRDQFAAVVNFGVYYGKSSADRLQMIKTLRASQNKENVSFMYDALSLFTHNELIMDIVQRSKEVFLNDINVLETINYDELRKGCAPKDIPKVLEAAQLYVLSDEPAFTRSVVLADNAYNGHIKHIKPKM